MNKYQKPAAIVVKLKSQTHFLQQSEGNKDPNGGSRELRSVWKDDEE